MKGKIYYFIKNRKMRHGEVFHYLWFIFGWYLIIPNFLLLLIFELLNINFDSFLYLMYIELSIIMILSGVLSHFEKIKFHYDRKYIKYRKIKELVNPTLLQKIQYFLMIFIICIHQIVISSILLMLGYF